MTTEQEQRPVIQADRECAVRIMADRWHARHQAEVLAGHHDDWIPVQEVAAHRLAQQPRATEAEPVAIVRKIETVAGDFSTEPGEPFWRIEIDGYCADFDYEGAALNFAAAINARVALAHPQAELSEAEPVAYQIRCLLINGTYSWRNPVTPDELASIRATGKDPAGIPYEMRPVYTHPQAQPSGDVVERGRFLIVRVEKRGVPDKFAIIDREGGRILPDRFDRSEDARAALAHQRPDEPGEVERRAAADRRNIPEHP